MTSSASRITPAPDSCAAAGNSRRARRTEIQAKSLFRKRPSEPSRWSPDGCARRLRRGRPPYHCSSTESRTVPAGTLSLKLFLQCPGGIPCHELILLIRMAAHELILRFQSSRRYPNGSIRAALRRNRVSSYPGRSKKAKCRSISSRSSTLKRRGAAICAARCA